MSVRMKYGEENIGIRWDMSRFLDDVGKEIADRTALIFMLKSDVTAADGAAEYSVTEGVSLVVSGETVTAYITNYASITAGVPYFIGIGIKFTGDTVYREVPLKANSAKIVFDQDVIRG